MYRLGWRELRGNAGRGRGLGRVEPVYEMLPGWRQPTGARPPAGRPPGGGPGLSGPAGGAFRGAGPVRERGDAAGSDHRGTRRKSVKAAVAGSLFELEQTDLLVIGAGPCGLAVGVAAKQAGLSCVLLDRRTIVSTIERYPLSMTFFSTPERIEIGGVPFIASHEKPTRRDGLIYYRRVAEHYGLDIRPGEDVVDVRARSGWRRFRVEVSRPHDEQDLSRRRGRLRHRLLRQPELSRHSRRGPPPRRPLFRRGASLLATAGHRDRGGEQQRGCGARVLAGRRDGDAGSFR